MFTLAMMRQKSIIPFAGAEHQKTIPVVTDHTGMQLLKMMKLSLFRHITVDVSRQNPYGKKLQTKVSLKRMKQKNCFSTLSKFYFLS